MWYRLLSSLLFALSLSRAALCTGAEQESIPAGAARIDVTPDHPVLLAGFGARTAESEGALTTLWARALAIGGTDPFVLVAVDNCGVPAGVVERAARRVADLEGVRRERFVVASTHTHCAPTLSGYAPVVWGGRASAEQMERVEKYTQWLEGKLVDAAREALAARRPARLSWAQGRVHFGGNRRVLRQGKWQGFGFQREGPVDHSLPVLAAFGEDGRLIALWTSYACHCTTLGALNQVCGDWAGFANELIEGSRPGAVALTTIGCGADVGPQPSGSLELAREHGRTIAKEVERLLTSGGKPLVARPQARMRSLRLPLEKASPREHWESESKKGGFDGHRAELMLEKLDRDGKLAEHVDYSVVAWTFGEELAVVFLPGEVVVDYAVRLKSELDWRRIWLNGWSNDVPCYIPSRRVLEEGGYEADFSMVYYAWPARFDAAVEEIIVQGVKDVVGPGYTPPGEGEPPPFLRYPPDRDLFAAHAAAWVRSRIAAGEGKALEQLVELAGKSQSGFARLVHNDGGEDEWFDYSGATRLRPYVRQLKVGDTIRWETPDVRLDELDEGAETHVFVFLGGLGWESEPRTAGFALLLGEDEIIELDVTRELASWKSRDGTACLSYFPTWTSSVDSGGLFYLAVAKGRLRAGKPCVLGVRSRGDGSKRWFAVDRITDPKAVERILAGAVKAGR
jgi:hypothetical protein